MLRTHSTIWFIMNGDKQILGRVADIVSRILLGLHKPIYAPNSGNGDCVVITNCANLVMHRNAWKSRVIRWHTGYPGQLRSMTHEQAHKLDPTMVLRRAVFKLLPVSKRRFMENLHLFPGDRHPFNSNISMELEGPSNFTRLSEFTPEQIAAAPRIVFKSDFFHET
ncbi:39S ribosomal protein L13, mitochondrial-like [Oopsacas minuta]|uniref:39S ribosomal protein L13, mitochondrial-like n=1 Tax=Oopsacas minuta TaxID=111878 RepID=A0AAV7JT75_9METZ|nr:39S ribosomal protein L13, mitochondrial-like [Oopsacas minuta]